MRAILLVPALCLLGCDQLASLVQSKENTDYNLLLEYAAKNDCVMVRRIISTSFEIDARQAAVASTHRLSLCGLEEAERQGLQRPIPQTVSWNQTGNGVSWWMTTHRPNGSIHSNIEKQRFLDYGEWLYQATPTFPHMDAYHFAYGCGYDGTRWALDQLLRRGADYHYFTGLPGKKVSPTIRQWVLKNCPVMDPTYRQTAQQWIQAHPVEAQERRAWICRFRKQYGLPCNLDPNQDP